MVDTPTSAELKTRYPEFISVDDVRVDLFIVEATRSVDDSWIEADQSPAIMSLACHQMSLEGEPTGASSNVKAGRFLKSRKVGDTSNEWVESSASQTAGTLSPTASQAGYRSTVYGTRFLRLMKLNHSGMVAV